MGCIWSDTSSNWKRTKNDTNDDDDRSGDLLVGERRVGLMRKGMVLIVLDVVVGIAETDGDNVNVLAMMVIVVVVMRYVMMLFEWKVARFECGGLLQMKRRSCLLGKKSSLLVFPNKLPKIVLKSFFRRKIRRLSTFASFYTGNTMVPIISYQQAIT